MMGKNNIILVGMPGCGKSTVGVVLAKAMGYSFIDTDILIQKREGMLLHDIISCRGAEGFIQLENEVNASVNAESSVIATGGSAVYGTEAMRHLQSIGIVVYIRLPLEDILQRVGDIGRASKRGVVMRQGQDLSDIYAQRTPLYEKYADITVDVSGISLKDTVALILDNL